MAHVFRCMDHVLDSSSWITPAHNIVLSHPLSVVMPLSSSSGDGLGRVYDHDETELQQVRKEERKRWARGEEPTGDISVVLAGVSELTTEHLHISVVLAGVCFLTSMIQETHICAEVREASPATMSDVLGIDDRVHRGS